MADKKPSNGTESDKRDNKGRFTKGNTAGGRKKMPDDIKAMFAAATPDAIKMLVECVNNPDEKTSDRIKAAEIVLDRHLGKAVQAVDIDAKNIPQVIIKGESDILD